MEDSEKIKQFILRSLMKKGKFGGAHTPVDNITHQLPDEVLNDKKGQKSIEKALKELVNLGWVLVMKKRTGKGSDLHISINPRSIKEIHEYLVQAHTLKDI